MNRPTRKYMGFYMYVHDAEYENAQHSLRMRMLKGGIFFQHFAKAPCNLNTQKRPQSQMPVHIQQEQLVGGVP